VLPIEDERGIVHETAVEGNSNSQAEYEFSWRGLSPQLKRTYKHAPAASSSRGARLQKPCRSRKSAAPRANIGRSTASDHSL